MGQADNKKGFYPVNPDAKITWLKVAASQTVARGDAAILSSGLAAIALANSAELCGVFAAPSVLATASTLVPVYADPDEVFEGRMDADSSSVTSGTFVDIIGATGAMMLDADASTTDVTVVLRSNPEDAEATAGARWLFKINKHAYADTSS